jgi:hypothetical protein
MVNSPHTGHFQLSFYRLGKTIWNHVESRLFRHHEDGGEPLKMNGRLTAVSGTIKPSAFIERSIEEFDCRDLTTKRV